MFVLEIVLFSLDCAWFKEKYCYLCAARCVYKRLSVIAVSAILTY